MKHLFVIFWVFLGANCCFGSTEIRLGVTQFVDGLWKECKLDNYPSDQTQKSAIIDALKDFSPDQLKSFKSSIEPVISLFDEYERSAKKNIMQRLAEKGPAAYTAHNQNLVSEITQIITGDDAAAASLNNTIF